MKCCNKLAKFFAMVAEYRLWWLIATLVIGIGFDQSTKIWAQSSLAEIYHDDKNAEIYYPIKAVTVVPKLMNFIYKENPAAAFSLTRSIPSWIRRPMLVSISLLASIFFIIWYFRIKDRDGLLLSSFSFILAGALGNLADRIRLGYVIDFIDVHAEFLGFASWHWPTFNVADSLIVVGAIGVLIRTMWPFKPANLNP